MGDFKLLLQFQHSWFFSSWFCFGRAYVFRNLHIYSRQSALFCLNYFEVHQAAVYFNSSISIAGSFASYDYSTRYLPIYILVSMSVIFRFGPLQVRSWILLTTFCMLIYFTFFFLGKHLTMQWMCPMVYAYLFKILPKSFPKGCVIIHACIPL